MKKIIGVICIVVSIGIFLSVLLAAFYEVITKTIDLSFLWSFALWVIPGVILLVLGKNLTRNGKLKEAK